MVTETLHGHAMLSVTREGAGRHPKTHFQKGHLSTGQGFAARSGRGGKAGVHSVLAQRKGKFSQTATWCQEQSTELLQTAVSLPQLTTQLLKVSRS